MKGIASQWKRGRLPPRGRKSENFSLDFFPAFSCPFGKGVSRIAIRAAQIARRQPDKNTRQSGKGALSLQGQINLVDNQARRHSTLIADILLASEQNERRDSGAQVTVAPSRSASANRSCLKSANAAAVKKANEGPPSPVSPRSYSGSLHGPRRHTAGVPAT